MTPYVCQPCRKALDATVRLPGSKSVTNRALVAAALADGTSVLSGILLAEDTRLMLDALGALGIAITVDEADATAEVTGCCGQLPSSGTRLFCGNSGTTIRFCAAVAGLGFGRYELDGVERMRKRPIGGLVDALRMQGASIEYMAREGFPPIAVHASGFGGGHISFKSPESSQFVSAMLLTAPYAMQDVLMAVTGGLPSIPYLKMTTAIMERFGVPVVEQYCDDRADFIIGAPQRYEAAHLAIEPDASNAAYFLAAPAVVGGRVTVEGLGTESIQGDTDFVWVLERMGCRVQRDVDRLTVSGPEGAKRLRGVDVDLNDMPDTVQTLAVVALFADGPTVIRNVANLRIKETDRLAALQSELTKLGATVEASSDGLTIIPPDQVSPAAIDTFNDHRMAMSFALAGLRCDGIVINDPECVGKTFPDFFERFEEMTVPPQ